MLHSTVLGNLYYLCIEFFMVLDFKVNKRIGCRDGNQFFFVPTSSVQPVGFRRAALMIKDGKDVL